jgi:hypothetical protein
MGCFLLCEERSIFSFFWSKEASVTVDFGHLAIWSRRFYEAEFWQCWFNHMIPCSNPVYYESRPELYDANF